MVSNEVTATVAMRTRVSPKVKTMKFVLTFVDGRGHARKRTIELPPKSHDLTAYVVYLLESTVEFDIPVKAVEAGLAEWFQRTEGELMSFLGHNR